MLFITFFLSSSACHTASFRSVTEHSLSLGANLHSRLRPFLRVIREFAVIYIHRFINTTVRHRPVFWGTVMTVHITLQSFCELSVRRIHMLAQLPMAGVLGIVTLPSGIA